jgi:hypothetical protein
VKEKLRVVRVNELFKSGLLAALTMVLPVARLRLKSLSSREVGGKREKFEVSSLPRFAFHAKVSLESYAPD